MDRQVVLAQQTASNPDNLGGQRAFQHEVEYYAKRGYACLSINWGGREMEDAKPGDPNTDNLFTTPYDDVVARGIKAMPPTLLHAVEHLEGNDILRAAMGSVGDGDYVDYFASTKREEFRAWHEQVTQQEVATYLTLF